MHCSFKPAIFWYARSAHCYNEHVYLARHYSTIACATALLQAENDSASSTPSTLCGRRLC